MNKGKQANMNGKVLGSYGDHGLKALCVSLGTVILQDKL
jgi:hypothetical protein